MKIVQAGSLLLGVLVAVFIVGGMVVPSLWQVSRSTIVAKSPEAIYPYLASLKKWEQWSVWTKEKDPTLQYTYEGPEMGVGARQQWTSEKMGNGWLEITEAHPETGLRFTLFIDMGHFQTTIEGKIQLEREGTHTKVTWSDHGDAGENLVKKWMSMIMDPLLGKQLETGLAHLRTLVEQSPTSS
jgi:hypothetical protein